MLASFTASFGSDAHATDYRFEWIGSNEFRMEGAFRTDTDEAEIITAGSVTCFRITGFVGSKTIGQWRLGDLDEDTAWHFNFAPESSQILTGGSYLSQNDQQWNSAAGYNMCGKNEFGFNAGSGGQELCFNGRLLLASSISGDTPLLAMQDETMVFDAEDCHSLAMS